MSNNRVGTVQHSSNIIIPSNLNMGQQQNIQSSTLNQQLINANNIPYLQVLTFLIVFLNYISSNFRIIQIPL